VRARLAALLLVLSVLAVACGAGDTATETAAEAEDASGDTPEVLRFGVGPFLPTTEDTEAAYDPFFAHVAAELGVDYELTATTDWAGIAVALANDQLDVAWMGPFGFVIANTDGGAEAIATVEYDGKPTYHSIIVGQPGLDITDFPADAEGMSISFAEVASTSGWLIPQHWFREQGIDVEAFFDYREGAAHPAQELAVANGDVDLATDFDRNRNAMIDSGAIEADATEIYWESEPLPNDAIAVRPSLDDDLVARIREIITGITPELAEEIMPPRYTGFVEADTDSYALIRDAANELGVLDR
jgi:phosphonate transport system substrate-binding protein